MSPKLNQTQLTKICQKLKFDFIKYSYLASGSHNECYLLKTKQADLVLKIENNPGYAKKEYDVLRKLPQGLGPQVYLYDGSKKIISRAYLVLEYLTGKNPSKKVSDKFVRQMAKWYKKLHSIRSRKLPAAELKEIKSLKHWAKTHYKSYLKNKKYLPIKLQQKLAAIFKSVINICAKNNKLFAAQKSFSLLQNDPAKDNIFIYPQQIRVIDWEFAGYGLAERDIFNFLTSYNLTARQKNLFLRTYGQVNAKKLKVLSILLYLGGYDYLANRISLITQGKIKKSQQSAGKKELLDKFRKLIGEQEELLNKF